MTLIPYSESEDSRWDSFVERATQGVFLHRRRYLGYHGSRFTDRSVLFENDKRQLRGLFPAALMPETSDGIVSHPGLTYGGLLHEPSCRADEVLAMFEALLDWYRLQGCQRLLYKAVPHHVQQQVVQSDLYALWRLGAVLVRRDLWNVLDLSHPRVWSKGHSWSFKRAVKAGLTVESLPQDDYAAFHNLLTETLLDRHAVMPVHSLAEMLELQQRFPGAIELWGCRSGDRELLAGVWLFKLHGRCWHSQYIASSKAGRDLSAGDLLLEVLISRAQTMGVTHFSFGSSTENGGRQLNAGLFGFKAGFGVGAVVQDFYEVVLEC